MAAPTWIDPEPVNEPEPAPETAGLGLGLGRVHGVNATEQRPNVPEP